MPTPLPFELYYLSNFRTALIWVGERYADLLTAEEQAFITAMSELAVARLYAPEIHPNKSMG